MVTRKKICKAETVEAEESRELEKNLYSALCSYCATLHIDARVLNATSAKKESEHSNLWRYPDVVGFEDALYKYEEPAFRLMKAFQKNRNSMYSFEVKQEIDNSTLRKSFFQAVANSSWANFSYLVAGKLDKGAETELRELCATYKLGFILLNKEKPSKSEILISAPYKAIDWNYVRRLAELSNEFLEYVETITKRLEDNSKPL